MKTVLTMAAAAVFLIVLVLVTLRTTSSPLGQSNDEVRAATTACEAAVRDEVPDARFPIAPNRQRLDDGRLQLSGSVDSGTGADAVRQNYECFLRGVPGDDGFVTDSAVVWQSH